MKYIKFLNIALVLFISSCEDKTISNYKAKETAPKNVSRSIISIKDTQKERFLDAINNARADTQDCGKYGIFPPAPPIKWNDALYKAAYEHSQDMALNGIVEHDGTNSSSDWTAIEKNLGRGSHFYERIENNGYSNYIITAENIAGGTYYDTPEIVVKKWLESPGHCKNLMNKYIKEFGLARVKKETKYVNYWSLELGALK